MDDILADLLRDEPFLRRMALQLVGEAAAAEDLLQETWLEVLRRPPLPGPDLRRWASTVLRRLAARRGRGEGRRRVREEGAARPERQEDPLGAVERRLDAQVLVVELLRGLPAVQRDALVLRHAHGLAPSAIAERQRSSLDTVKARLRRGLATLREELDRRHGGERAHWVALLLPLTRRPAAPPAAAGGALSLGGALAMSLTTKILVVATTAIAAGVFLHSTSRDDAPLDPPLTGIERQAAAADLAHERDARADTREAEHCPARALVDREPDRTAATPVAADLVVHLVGGPADEVEVHVFAEPGAGDLAEPRAVERSSAPGTLRFALSEVTGVTRDGAPPAALRVRAEHLDHLPTETRLALGDAPLSTRLEATLELRRAALLVGRVANVPEGARADAIAYDIAGAIVKKSSLASSRVAEDGSFRLRLDQEGEVALAVLCAGWRPSSARTHVAPGHRADVGTLTLESGASIDGVARDDAGGVARAPVEAYLELAGAEVFAGDIPGRPYRLKWVDGRFEVGRIRVRTDESGQFRLSGLAPAAHWLSLAKPVGALATWRFPEPLRVIAPASGVVLTSGWALLELSLALPEDLEGYGMLWMGTPGWRPNEGTSLHASTLRQDPVVRVGLAPGDAVEAHVKFAGYEPVVIEVRAERSGEVIRRAAAIRRPAGTIRLVLDLAGAQLPDGSRFMLLDGEAQSGNDPGAVLFPKGEPSTAELERGRLVFGGVPGGHRRLRLVPGGAPGERIAELLDVELELDLPWSGEHTETVRLQRGGALRVEVLDGAGRHTTAAARLYDTEGRVVPIVFIGRGVRGNSATSTSSVSNLGRNDVTPNLAPGDYVLRLDVEGFATYEEAVEIETGKTTDVSVVVGRR